MCFNFFLRDDIHLERIKLTEERYIFTYQKNEVFKTSPKRKILPKDQINFRFVCWGFISRCPKAHLVDFTIKGKCSSHYYLLISKMPLTYFLIFNYIFSIWQLPKIIWFHMDYSIVLQQSKSKFHHHLNDWLHCKSYNERIC